MDIKTICVIGSFVLSFCTFIGGAIGFCILKFNDGYHLQLEFKENKKEVKDGFVKVNNKLDTLTDTVNKQTTQLAVINEKLK